MSISPPERDELPGVLPTLVLTKTFVPPERGSLIRRTELIDRLSDKRDRSVTLVHAPAGYGKSTVLMQWAKADPIRRFGWVTLDETENDPVHLWRYLLWTLRALAPGLADDAWRLLTRPRPDLRAVASQAINALVAVPGRLVLVLDDYHVITNPECHASIQYLLDHLSRSTQVALGTRTQPPLSLAKLSGRGMMLEIDATALQFTLEETRAALERAHGRPSGLDAARIYRYTEGWPAGVLLSTIGEEPGPTHGVASSGHRAVRAYLMEQVLAHFSEDDRQILAEWSIVRRLNGRLCDRVTGHSDSAIRLEQLSERYLMLTPIDEQGTWYRFHDLLRDELRRVFDRQPIGRRDAAHLRAMEWWLENGEIPEAVHHAIEAHQFDRAGELISSEWFRYLLSGRLETLRRWIDQFPPQALLTYPPLLVAAAWIAAFSGDVAGTHRFAAAAREAAHDQPMPDGAASYASAVAMLRAGLGIDGLVDAHEQAELAYQLEPKGNPWRPAAAVLAGVTRFALGRYDDARLALTEASRSPIGPDGVATYARGQLALLEMAEDDWMEGSRQADLACAMIDRLSIGDLLSSGVAQVAAAAAAAHAGKPGLASQRLHSLAQVQGALSDAIPFDAFQINLIAAETYLAIGDRSAAKIHALSALAHLEAFGDGGIFEERLGAIHGMLADSAETLEVPTDQPEQLTDRELQVLTLLQTDLSLRDISHQLFVSRNTAKTHVANLYRKLGATNRTAAIERARQLDLI
ncbi:MAG: LuxR C-terminal-related transcriptional regulator [Pseudomonadota bacterium]|nr:LuxR C-terminal-related transcriptional regulator [Pseudomonadota bacterium]